MNRKSRSKKELLRIFNLHNGRCHLCGEKIKAGKPWELEHIIPFWVTGDDSDENVAPAHPECHKPKTKKDKKDIAKIKRIQLKHTGARKAKGTIPGSRDSKWKRRIDGTIERRRDK